MKLTLKQCYHSLGLEPGASSQQVNEAYRRLASAYHPDRDPALGHQVFARIQHAYHTLLIELAGTSSETDQPDSEAPNPEPVVNRRQTRRGTPGHRRFESVTEDQYKGTQLRTDV